MADMTDSVSPERIAAMRARLEGWRKRLEALGLEALLEAAAPLAPLGAQLLWVAQPTLSLLIDSRDIDALASILDGTPDDRRDAPDPNASEPLKPAAPSPALREES